VIRRINKLIKILIRPEYFIPLVTKRVAAGVEHEKLLRNLDCKFLVDIGANRGQFSLVVKQLFPNIQIHAFEPLLEPGDVFLSLFKDDPNITLHRVAVGSKSHTSTMHVSAKDHSSSILPITDKQVELYPHTQEVDTREVSVRPLQDALSGLDIPDHALIKIDVQGYELEALKGCESLLEQFEHIYVECSFIELYQGQALAQDIISFLNDRKFGLRGVYNVYSSKQGETVQADFYFAKMVSGK
jgi:FkbM family methyltransferase